MAKVSPTQMTSRGWSTVGRKLGRELHSDEEFRVTQWFATSATAVGSSPETRRCSPHRHTTPGAATTRIEPCRWNFSLQANGVRRRVLVLMHEFAQEGRRGEARERMLVKVA
jgi:hypothetical protein